MTTAWVGFGTTFGRARGVNAPCKEGSGWAKLDSEEGLGLRGKRGNAARQLFPETENVRRLTDYIVAIVIRWGVKQTPSAMKLGRRPTYTITTPHDNFQPILRTFSGHL